MGEENNNLNNNVVMPQNNIGGGSPAPAPVVNVAPVQQVPVTPTPAPVAPVTPAQVIEPAPVVQEAPVVVPPAPAPVTNVEVTPAVPVVEPAPAVAPAQEVPITPAQPATIDEKTEDAETPIPSNNQDIKVNAEDLIVPGDEETNDKTNNKYGIKDEDIKIEEKDNKKVPIVVLVLFFAILLVVVIYYYIVMTPEHVMDNAVNSLYDTVHNIFYNVKDENDLGLKAELQVDSGLEIHKYINNMSLTGKSLILFDEEKAMASLESEDNKTIEPYDAQIFFNDGLYITNKELEKTLIGKVMKSDNKYASEYGFENIDSAFEALRKVKDHIITVSDNSFLDRKLATIDINGQTTIAIEAIADLESKEFADFYYDVMDGLLGDDAAIKEFSKFSNRTTEDVVKNFEWLRKREFTEDSHITINLYMNLANTQLISMELSLDEKYYIKLDNLNGYFFVIFKMAGQQEKPDGVTIKEYDEPGFYLKFEYDSNKGLLSGTGNSRIPGENELYAEYKYIRKQDEKNGTKLGNDLIIDFYNYYTHDETKLRKELEKTEEHLIAHVQGKLDIWRTTEEIEKEFGSLNEKTKKYEINFKGEKDLVKDPTAEMNRQSKEGMYKFEHYIKYCLRNLRYNKLDDKAYDIMFLTDLIESSGATRSEIESEQRKANSMCDGNIALPITGRLRISEIDDNGMTNIDKLILLDEETTFKWACVYEKKDYYELDLNDFNEVIKANELNRKDVNVTEIEVTPQELNLKVGEVADIAVSIHGEGDELSYKSKDTSIATISEGKVTAKKEGNTEIVISTKKGISKKVKVTVTSK